MEILKIQKMKNNKYKINLDSDSIITFDNVILKYNLLYKKEISSNELNKIISESNYYDVYNKTLNFSTKKVRSEKEVKNYLNKFNIDIVNKDKIVEKLKELNLINDRNYCKAFINDKIYLSKYGINKIKKMLIKEEIDSNIIEDEMSKIDTGKVNQNLENKIIKKIESNHKYSNYELRKKLFNYFLNEGYNAEDIIFYLDKYEKEDSNILEKEFDRFYNKYKNKYNKLEFKIKLKYKLIQRGFKNDEIETLIKKKTEE